jgi:hypothetical protein
MRATHLRRLRKLSIRRNRGTPHRCRVCAVSWLPGASERHRQSCPIYTITCEAITDGVINLEFPLVHGEVYD